MRKSTPYTGHHPIIGTRLWRIALDWSRHGEPATQADRNAKIKACKGRKKSVNGSAGVTAARVAVERAAADIRGARSARKLKMAWRPRTASRARPWGQLVTYSGTPEQRLGARTRGLLRLASPLRYGAAGGGDYKVVLTRDPAAVSYSVALTVNYDTYRGAYKGWAAREDNHTVTVPHAWLTRVHKRGLACIDGLLTLDAAPLDHAPDGVRLYAAVWAEQGRGYEVHTRRGVLAIADDRTAYHGGSADKAVRGLQRKLAGRRLAAEWAAVADASIERFRAAVAPHSKLKVRVADARAIGACEYGIRSWCNAVGLDYDAGAATLAEVLAGYEQQPAPEARATIIHALRRARRPVALPLAA